MRTKTLGILLALAALPAAADGVRLPPNPAYRAECGSCHVAYPPQLLPKESWQKLMARLDRHFGSDASLDPESQQEIGRFLATNAGRRAAPPGAEPRITETRWFRKEHGAVKNSADCMACHKRADQGDYDDD
jgi:hypothetical protein